MEGKELSKMRLSSGPLQGLTDDVFRMAHHQIFGGIDHYYGPYVRLDENKESKKSQRRDAESTLNIGVPYIPQVLGNQPQLILEEMKRLKQLGHKEINWNLGCPYPMVTNRKMGAGLLNQPELVKEILEEIIPENIMDFSIKCRLGYENDSDIFSLMEVFNKFPLKEIIIHARTAKQMYKGLAHPEKMVSLISLSKHPLAYNGDINSKEKMEELDQFFQGSIKHMMIGRALLMNPFLALEAKGVELSSLEKKNKLIEFHHHLIDHYSQKLQDHQLLMKMRTFWEYFSHSFSDPHKTFKMIKKSKNWREYQISVGQIFHQYL